MQCAQVLVQYTLAKRLLYYKVYTPCNKNVIGKTKNVLKGHIFLYVRSAVMLLNRTSAVMLLNCTGGVVWALKPVGSL